MAQTCWASATAVRPARSIPTERALYNWSTRVREDLKPGERVLDLRAVTRSAAIFVGLVVAPIAARMAALSWGYAAGAAFAGMVLGFLVGIIAGKVLFPAPRGQAVVVRWGGSSLPITLKASLCGGGVMAIGIAVAALFLGGITAAGPPLIVGVIVAACVGCCAALL
jgi:hypothetical protein